MADLFSLVVLASSQGRTPSDQLEAAAVIRESREGFRKSNRLHADAYHCSTQENKGVSAICLDHTNRKTVDRTLTLSSEVFMPNPTDTTPESEGQNSWPRKILIQPTAAKAIEMLGDRYDSSRDPEGDDALMFQIGYEFRIYAEINSWDHFADKYAGYELLYPATVSEQRPTFQSIFFEGNTSRNIQVPDYQRAFSWEKDQIDLFIKDLKDYQGTDYYFGHFIVEANEAHWELVDGQQRITTFVLFLMVCQVLDPACRVGDPRTLDQLGIHLCAYSIIKRFFTVSYDREAMENIHHHLESFLRDKIDYDDQDPALEDHIINALSIERKTFTQSQKRIVSALIRFYQAFQKGKLEKCNIGDYIKVVMSSHCSIHLAPNKSVAVNIFEMHNTRGVALTPLEIIKAKLMKFVYDNGGQERELKVKQIQSQFSEIYRMEEQVTSSGFRGELTMDRLLTLHLRVVDDGTKLNAQDLDDPALNVSYDKIVEYVESKLHFIVSSQSNRKVILLLGSITGSRTSNAGITTCSVHTVWHLN